MGKVRLGALAVAVALVAAVATPASAATVVNRFRGKDLNAIVTNCTMNATPGTICEAWSIFAAQQRVRQDGSVTSTASLELTKFRVRLVRREPGFVATPVANGVSDNVSLSVATNLASASASGVATVVQCNTRGTQCRSFDVHVTVHLTANAPLNFNRGRVVTKFGDCKVTDRFNSQSRPAGGSATINGKSFVTTPIATSTIDSSFETTVFRNCPTPPPGP
jgi:hypothetical protein